MDSFFFVPILIGFMPLGVIVAVIVMVVRRPSATDVIDPGIGTTRRLFMYGLAFLALMLATIGVTMLLSSILETLFSDEVFRRDSGKAAFGLAGAIVGLPIWALLWRASARSLQAHPVEAGTLGRKLYAYAILTISAAVVASSAMSSLRDLLGIDRFEASSLATPIVWAMLWALHWRWEKIEGQPSVSAVSLRYIYIYLTAAYGLALLAGGTFALLLGLLDRAYSSLTLDGFLGSGLADIWNDNSRGALVAALIGGAWWWFHWHRAAADDHSSGGRLVVVYVLGIFGGMITAMAGVSTFVFSLLNWVLGPRGTTAASHFDVLPTGLALAVVGIAVWVYHRVVALDDAKADAAIALSATRAYRYLTAAVGLGALAFGLATEVGLVVGLLANAGGDVIRTGRWWATPLAFSLTALGVGAGLWGRQWLLQQTRADAANPAERTTQSRRTYMFAVFGISVLATLIAASIVLFQVLRTILDGELSAEVFDDVKYGIGVVAAAGVISGYHWRVLKEDREAEAATSTPEPSARIRKQVTAVATSAARPVVEAIEAKVGVRFTVWDRRDDAGAPTITDDRLDAIVSDIANAPSQRVLLLIDATGVHVIPV